MKMLETTIVEKFEPSEIRKWTLVPIITVYWSPVDFPGKHVARLFDINHATPLAVVADSYEELVRAIPEDMVKLPRRPEDDPVIREVWI